jgi:hypothetical protein
VKSDFFRGSQNSVCGELHAEFSVLRGSRLRATTLQARASAPISPHFVHIVIADTIIYQTSVETLTSAKLAILRFRKHPPESHNYPAGENPLAGTSTLSLIYPSIAREPAVIFDALGYFHRRLFKEAPDIFQL